MYFVLDIATDWGRSDPKKKIKNIDFSIQGKQCSFFRLNSFKNFRTLCIQGHYECCLNLLDFGMHIVRRILHLRFDLEFEV